MKKLIATLLCLAMVLSCGCIAFANDGTKHVATTDGLLQIDLPNNDWFQVTSDENSAMFSDGDCAILVNLYKNGDVLPAISTADANHEFIYTAACSTSDYILVVTGYAHERVDFSAMCRSINSIDLNIEKVTEKMLTHVIPVDEYAVKSAEYYAWVSASGLNVRSASGTDASIVTVLSRGERVTVTGLVTKNGAEIGWAQILTSKGVKGYVSSQFLTTQSSSSAVNVRPGNITRTGTCMVVYRSNGSPVILYLYSDNNYYDDAGVCYVGVADTALKNSVTGELVYNTCPEVSAQEEAFMVVGNDGDTHYLSYIGSDIWVNKNNIEFYMTGVAGEYISQYGYYFHSSNYVYGTGHDYMPSSGSSSSSSDSSYSDNIYVPDRITIWNEEGAVYVISDAGSDSFISDEGYYFYRTRTRGVWIDDYGIYYYDSTFNS